MTTIQRVNRKFLTKEDFESGRHFLWEQRLHRYAEMIRRQSGEVLTAEQMRRKADEIYVRCTPAEREMIVPCPVCVQLIGDSLAQGINPWDSNQEVVEGLRNFGICYRPARSCRPPEFAPG